MQERRKPGVSFLHYPTDITITYAGWDKDLPIVATVCWQHFRMHSPNFVPVGPIRNSSHLIQVIAWHQMDTKL